MYALPRERVCLPGSDTGNVVIQPLSSNGRWWLGNASNSHVGCDVSLRSWFDCHIASSLRLFVPNNLTVYQRSLLSKVPTLDATFLSCSCCFLPRCSPRRQSLPPLPPFVRSSRATIWSGPVNSLNVVVLFSFSNIVVGQCFYINGSRSNRRFLLFWRVSIPSTRPSPWFSATRR
jgi:hypothetical protein